LAKGRARLARAVWQPQFAAAAELERLAGEVMVREEFREWWKSAARRGREPRLPVQRSILKGEYSRTERQPPAASQLLGQAWGRLREHLCKLALL